MKKIKVLQFICPTGFYGAERWILALADNSNREKIQCELAVTSEGDEELELTSNYKKLGLPSHEIPMKGRFDLKGVSRLAKVIKDNDIDIIHTHGYKSDILGVLAAKKAGIKSVCTPHGFENSKDIKLRTFIWLGCQSMRFFDKVVPLSKQLCEEVKPYGIHKEKLAYIQNGVNLKEVESTRDDNSIPATTSKKRIGFIGQLISRKNIADILAIFDTLHKKDSNIELYFVGDGDERKKLHAVSQTLSSAKDIHFLGFRKDRLALLKSFDLFVMTSSLEGIPRCLMEAMAMGVPVAAYDIPGIDQLIAHKKTGLLASFGDKDSLQKHWETLLYNRETSEDVSRNGIDYVNRHFSAKRMSEEYASLFDNLIAEK